MLLAPGILYMESPLGWILLEGDAGLEKVQFLDQVPDTRALPPPPDVLRATQEELNAFFAGKLQRFTVPLSPPGTDFQQKVWEVLTTIPFGKTWSYLDLAETVGSRLHTRAVGLANGKNPVGVIIPCHRVVGSNGSLTGYAGGLWRKKWLLQHEAAHSGAGIQTLLF